MTIKEHPSHVRLKSGENFNGFPMIGDFKDDDYDFSTEIPHFINKNSKQADAIITSDTELKSGDEIRTEYGGVYRVAMVLQRRKARGDWSKNRFDKSPDYVLFSFAE